MKRTYRSFMTTIGIFDPRTVDPFYDLVKDEVDYGRNVVITHQVLKKEYEGVI